MESLSLEESDDAKNRHATESEILGAWMDVLGKQRVTDKLYAKFKEFWVEAKRTI